MSISQLGAQERLRATMAVAALRSNAVRPSTSTTAVSRQPDGVSISDAARSMASAVNTVGGADDVREDRIAALKASIADGTYHVSSRDLALSMTRAAL